MKQKNLEKIKIKPVKAEVSGKTLNIIWSKISNQISNHVWYSTLDAISSGIEQRIKDQIKIQIVKPKNLTNNDPN